MKINLLLMFGRFICYSTSFCVVPCAFFDFKIQFGFLWMECDGNDPITMDPSDDDTKKSEFKIMISSYSSLFCVFRLQHSCLILFSSVISNFFLFQPNPPPLFLRSSHASPLFHSFHNKAQRKIYRNPVRIEKCHEKNEKFPIIYICCFLLLSFPFDSIRHIYTRTFLQQHSAINRKKRVATD